MTQLPEVEVLRKDLEKEVVGKRVKIVEVGAAKVVRRHRNRPQFAEALDGRKIEGVARRGTWLLLQLDEGKTLVVGPGSQGQLVREAATAEAGTHTRAVVTFTTGGALHLVDPAEDAEMFVTDTAGLDEVADLNPGGIDPLAGTLTWHEFGTSLASRARALKPLLVDESFVVGLGDLYSDEVLWTAGLAGARRSDRLSSQEVRRLYRALFEVLYEAVKQGGAGEVPAASDDAFGEGTEASERLKVHGRAGEPCPRCRRPIELGEVDGLALYHCPSCQT